ncbi:unnamed protein product [Callosobruchus maculatus]|uniref:G-protein coupled receptors family 1 profile domain-containing protein n=1 Tax=Callosobruchus maculatus TaxID=64391 RepID=A0A653DSW8_CALMS|nr:unnamed protein product [Callosobruchus maculatus]
MCFFIFYITIFLSAFPYYGKCDCRKEDLLCDYKNLERAPFDIPRENISILDLTGNNFKVLNDQSVRGIPDNVERLILSHCNITEIHPGALVQLENTKLLHLDNNHIKYLPQNIFAKENKLEALSLMYNSLMKIHPRAFVYLQNLQELDLRGNKLEEIDKRVLEPLLNLRILYLQNNQIKYVGASNFPTIPLEKLSLVDNKIINLERSAFSNLGELRNLFLSHNQLEKLKNGTFLNLGYLEALTLNKNYIKQIEIAVFQDVPILQSLQLKTMFEMCSSALHVRNCYPKGDGISNQEHMLAKPILRICVWVMGAIGCTGNVVVLLGRHFAPTNNVVHSLYLRNLAFSDLLMGVYLFIIAGEDLNYRGVYLRYQWAWRHSFVCKLCGFLSTLSCESSVLILSLVTWDRFVSVTQPLARKQPSPKTAAATLLLLWCIATLVAFAPITPLGSDYFGDEFYGNNGVCLSLHIHEPYAKGWQYSAVMFILINTMALIFISYAYLRMINEIRASGVACRSTRQSQDRDKVAQRFGIIVLTDCLCWVPVIAVKLIALAGTPIHQNLYAWLAIFVLPINSALNPVLYTLTTTIFKKQMSKMIHSCWNKRKRCDHQTASESALSLSLGGGTQSSSLLASKNSWKRSTAV